MRTTTSRPELPEADERRLGEMAQRRASGDFIWYTTMQRLRASGASRKDEK